MQACVWSGVAITTASMSCLLVEHLAVVGVPFRLRVSLERFAGIVGIDVAQGDDVFGFQIGKVDGALAPDADARDVQLFAGRFFIREAQDAGLDEERRRDRSRGMHESA